MKKGWQTKRLGDFAAAVSTGPFGSILHKSDYVDDGVPLVNPINIVGDSIVPDPSKLISAETIKRLSNYVLDDGDVVVGRRGEIGRCAVIGPNEKGWVCGTGSFFVRPLPSLDSQFLAHLIRSPEYREQLEKLSTGATMKNLSNTALGDLVISVPPLPEQQRIVGLLDEAFAGLATAKANAEKNLQNARALFESHLQSVFTQRGKGCVDTTLGEIGKISMCKRIFKEETTAAGDIPFYKIGTFGKEPDAFIPNQTYNEYRAKYSFPKKGDVLISASGTIGRRVRYDGEPAYFQDSNIVWIDNDEKQVLNDYLFHFYGACEWNSTKGATISRLYNDNLRRIAIGFPTSLQEQRRIVAQLDALSEGTQRLASLYERKLAALEALKKSLLHQAFTGEL